jgi:hypothetical protein
LRHLRKSLAQWGRLSWGSLLVGLVLLLNAMAASPELHELIHADAGHADHQCAVTLFGHGQIDSSVVAMVPAAATASFPICFRFEIFAFAPAIENLPAGRAPPAAVSSPV